MTLPAASAAGTSKTAVMSPPEAGQLVEVRRRQWVVADTQFFARRERTFLTAKFRDAVVNRRRQPRRAIIGARFYGR